MKMTSRIEHALLWLVMEVGLWAATGQLSKAGILWGAAGIAWGALQLLVS
jgi:hypothetical protein